MTRIVVLDGYTLNPGDNPWDALAALGELTVYDRTSSACLMDRARPAAVLLTNKTPLAASALAQLAALRFIAVLATGYNIVDVAAARARGIPVSNVPEYGTDSVAQHVFALLLELNHRVAAHDAAIRAGDWTAAADFCFWKAPPVELAGLTMAVVGYGRIGRRVGELAHAFGMRVIAAGGERQVASCHHPLGWRSIEQAFAEGDVVSLHCPLTAGNAGFVNRDLLRRMKPTALLINTARGGLVDEEALAEALDAGWLAGAALDVVSVEPIRPENPLLRARGCVLTPHMAWGSLAARRRLMAATVENVAAFLRGSPINVVN